MTTATQTYTPRASKSWRVLECNPRWGLDGKATGREVYIEIEGQWGDAGKDAKLIEAAPQLLAALQDMLLAYEGDAGDTDSPACIGARAAIERAEGS